MTGRSKIVTVSINTETLRKPDGLGFRFHEFGAVQEEQTRQCRHCGCHFLHEPGRLRGYCQSCAGPLCGAPACVMHGCTGHFEKKLEQYEAQMREIERRLG